MSNKRSRKDLPQPIIQVDNSPQNDIQMNYAINAKQMTNVWSYNLESGTPEVLSGNGEDTSVNYIDSLFDNHKNKDFNHEIHAIVGKAETFPDSTRDFTSISTDSVDKDELYEDESFTNEEELSKEPEETFMMFNQDTTYLKASHPKELTIIEKTDGIFEITHGNYGIIIFWIVFLSFAIISIALLISSSLHPVFILIFGGLALFSFREMKKSYKSFSNVRFDTNQLTLSNGLISKYKISRNASGIKILYNASLKKVLINLYGSKHFINCDTYDEMHFIAGIISFYFQSHLQDDSIDSSDQSD